MQVSGTVFWWSDLLALKIQNKLCQRNGSQSLQAHRITFMGHCIEWFYLFYDSLRSYDPAFLLKLFKSGYRQCLDETPLRHCTCINCTQNKKPHSHSKHNCRPDLLILEELIQWWVQFHSLGKIIITVSIQICGMW